MWLWLLGLGHYAGGLRWSTLWGVVYAIGPISHARGGARPTTPRQSMEARARSAAGSTPGVEMSETG